MKTLQEHYNAINIGQGNKAQFVKQARNLFPEYFNQYTNYDNAVSVLKSKQIISEVAGGVVGKGFDIWDWKKILAEETKAVEKEISKEAAEANKNAYDNSDMKNADNVNFNEIMKGFFAEMYEEKNKGKTGDEIKAMVVKNLAKDALYYTKNGNFSTMGVGYTTEAPGLGEPKEPKGKHKASGYGDIEKEVKVKSNVQDSLGNSEAKTSMPKKVKEMPDKGVTGTEKKIKLQESIGMMGGMHGEDDFNNAVSQSIYSEYKNLINSKNWEELKKKIEQEYPSLDAELVTQFFSDNLQENKETNNKKISESEQKLRSLIHNIIKEELNKGSVEVNGKTVKTYTQNGDTSYNVTYDDGTKDIIYVNNDGWDEINQLHRNAIGDDAYRKQFSKK